MSIILTTLATAIAITFYIKIVSLIDSRKYHKKYKSIFTAHKQLGFPRLSDEQQFDILDNENTSYVSSLTEFEFIPSGLLDHYITIDPDKYIEHLRTLDLRVSIKFDPTNLKDGFFIRQAKTGYEYLFVEKQQVHIVKRAPDYDKLIKYLACYTLNLYAPKQYHPGKLEKHLA